MSKLINIFPGVTLLSQTDERVVLALTISDTLDYFKGHFDQAPILAGVVQLDWAVKYAHQFLGFPQWVNDIEVLKFQMVITPNVIVNLLLERNNNGKCIFKYSSDKGQHASGRLVYAQESP